MSHFTVMVVGDDVEAQLQPYHEYECTGIKDEYVVFVDKKKDMLYKFNKDSREMLVDIDGNIEDPWDDKFYRDPTQDEREKIEAGPTVEKDFNHTLKDWNDGLGYRPKVKFIPDGYVKKEIILNKIYKTVEDYCRDWHGYTDESFVDGKIGIFTNPNSKWDWYQIGGRWAGSLKLKQEVIEDIMDGLSEFDPKTPNFSYGWSEEEKAKALKNPCVDIAPKKIIDIEAMEAPMIKEASSQWDGWHSGIKNLSEDNIEKKEWINKNLGWFITKLDIKNITEMSREEYIACKSIWSPYALIWDRKWYAQGKMGWFATSFDEENNWSGQFKELWKEIPDSEIITMVDCHI